MTWLPASLMVLAVALAAGFAWYERRAPSARVLALVGALAALAVVGRIAFAAVPNVKPTTDIVLFSGLALGGAPGFAVGALAALVSNFFFGQGPWTAWQMAAWGGVGVFGAVLGKLARGRELSRVQLAAGCAVAGIFFGMVMDLFQWTLGEPHTPAAYAAVSVRSIGFNAAHVIGNVVFCLLIGPAFVRALRRYRRRFEVSWPSPRTATGVAATALALAIGLAALAPAPADASPSGRAIDYLRGAQNADGGFGAARGQGSTQLHSGWVALGLSSAGRNPRAFERGGNSPIDFLRGGAGALTDTGELERTILVLRASGVNPRDWAGRDLVAELLKRRRSTGSFGTVNWTAFGVLSLKASGVGGNGKSVAYLVKQQNSDGGYGFSPSASSDADDTGAVLQALAAGGKRGSRTTRRAVAYLRKTQHSDGGFGQMATQPSNAQSTAWAVQGLVAAGRNPAAVKKGGRSPIDFLRSLQRSDGSFRYSRRSAQTPVWVTAQVLTALERKPFPLRPARLPARAARTESKEGESKERARARARKREAERARDKEDKPADEADAAVGAGGAGAPGPPSADGARASETLSDGRKGSAGDDSARTIAIAVVAALALIGMGWWRHRRGDDPLAD